MITQEFLHLCTTKATSQPASLSMLFPPATTDRVSLALPKADFPTNATATTLILLFLRQVFLITDSSPPAYKCTNIS